MSTYEVLFLILTSANFMLNVCSTLIALLSFIIALIKRK